MRLTVKVDDEVFARVRRAAEAMGTSVEELVREYLVRLADADEFERLSKLANGSSREWEFNREEIHGR